MIEWFVLFFTFSAVRGAIPPFLNCTRYLEPCVSRQGDCCGYPFYDCLSDGREPLCQSIQDFPELSAELLLRLREAKDRGDPAVKEIHKDVYELLGPNKKPAEGGKKKGKSSEIKGKSPAKKGGKGTKKKEKKVKKESKKSSKKKSKSTKKKPSEKKKED